MTKVHRPLRGQWCGHPRLGPSALVLFAYGCAKSGCQVAHKGSLLHRVRPCSPQGLPVVIAALPAHSDFAPTHTAALYSERGAHNDLMPAPPRAANSTTNRPLPVPVVIRQPGAMLQFHSLIQALPKKGVHQLI